MSESSASSRIKRLVNTYSGLVLMGAVGIPIGVIVGAIGTVKILSQIDRGGLGPALL